MINAVIIENEEAALEKLLNTLKEVAPDLKVKVILGSVKESIQYFRENLLTDIIFCGVQLPDGLSFEIFSEARITAPAIFISGFDDISLYAFENNGIDYLLKPVKKNDLARSILKYKMLKRHFTIQNPWLYNLPSLPGIKKQTRLVAKRGLENVSIRFEDIIMFYTDNKLVYVIDKSGQKCIVDTTLNDLESRLDSSLFFRANRQYIINLNFVKSYKPYERVKIQVHLDVVENIKHLIIVSQGIAPGFRKWISEA